MPYANPKPCAMPGCPNLVSGGGLACDACKQSRSEPSRPSAAARGYDRRWQTYRAQYLLQHPLCVDPYNRHIGVMPATVVDHIRPHRGDDVLFWLATNHQPLCKSCHDHKTATEDGGFGH